jgi:thiamine biosynthesis lipoprotein
MNAQDRHCFAREAMAAMFQITVAEADPVYARQAAAAALAELEEVENRLSRYVETSDIFRINRLAPGQMTTIHPDTFECLRMALEVQAATGGAFDVAYASTASNPLKKSSVGVAVVLPPPEECRKIGVAVQLPPQPLVPVPLFQQAARPADGPPIELIEPGCVVRALADEPRLDLGAIGKGFALDRMAALLAQWDLGAALLSASTSSVLALSPPPGEPGWAIHVGTDHAPRRLWLLNQAIGASGTAVRGAHIVDPRTGRPAEGKFRAWAIAPTAAEADALSTAFMVMADDEVNEYCRCHPDISAHLLHTPAGELVTVSHS